jgi:glycosyltransferase involved in cell wall biosynthesis
MRITYLNYMYDLYGVSIGSTIKALELYKALEKENHQVEIHWRQGESRPLEYQRRNLRQFMKRYLGKLFQEPNQLVRNVSYFWGEKCILKKDRPDLLISRLEAYLCSPVFTANLYKIPHIVEADSPAAYEVRHFYPEYLRHSDLMERIELKMIQHADRAFCVSNQLKSHFVARGIAEEKMQVITNGVDVSRFHPNVPCQHIVKKHRLKGKTVVGFVGSFHFWHGVENLVRLIDKITTADSDVAFMMVGRGGALKPDLDRFISERNLEDRVFCTGFVPHDEVPAYINAMDVVVAPYPPLEFFYYSPVKIYEYMACGKAVVTSGIGQIAELIEHGKTGLLCAPGDTRSLINAVQRLLRNRAMRRTIGRNASVYISHNHTWAHKARQLSVLCEDVVRSHNRRLTI